MQRFAVFVNLFFSFAAVSGVAVATSTT